MKKSIFLLTVVSLLAIASLAQTNKLSYSAGTTTDPSVEKSPPVKSIAQSKVEMNFLRLHKQTESMECFEIPGGFQLHYREKGKNGRSYFDRKGRFQYRILTYGEADLPLRVRSQVKCVFFLDYRITNVTEINYVHKPGQPIYLINITNDKVWKKVRVADDELEVVEEFKAS